MAKQDLLDLIEERSQDMNAMQGKVPKKGSWGFYCWGDAPAAIGGGVGAYHWEGSRAGAIRFLRNYALAMYLPRAGLDLFAINTEVERITDAMKAGTLADAAALKALNKSLQHVVQFDWIGEYTELRDGNTKYAKALRKRFRNDSSAAPILKSEKASWLEFLEQAGL
jgi:hypothetical protein